MGHRFLLIGMVVLATLVGASCGGGDDEGDHGNGGGAGTTPSAGASGGGAGAAAGAGGGDMCVSEFMASGQSAACAMCACTMCATEVANLEALSATDRPKADAVLDCATENCCSGTACYCGEDDVAACLMAMPPKGKCVAPIEAAAGAMGLAGIATPSMMPTTPLGVPTALGRCLNGDGAMVAGKCPACMTTCN